METLRSLFCCALMFWITKKRIDHSLFIHRWGSVTASGGNRTVSELCFSHTSREPSKSLWTHEPHFTFEAGLKRPYTRLLYIQTLNWIIKTISFSEVEQVCRDLSRCCRLVNKAKKNKEKLTQHRYTQDSRTKSNTAIYPQCLYLHTNNCVQSKWCCRLTVNDGNNIVSAASVRSHSSSPFALGCSSSREVRERRSAQSLHLFNISADSFLLC